MGAAPAETQITLRQRRLPSALTDVSTALVYTWRRKLRDAHAEPEPDDLAAPGFAAAVMIEDAEATHTGPQPAIVIDLARGKRISIFASATPELVASAMKALR